MKLFRYGRGIGVTAVPLMVLMLIQTSPAQAQSASQLCGLLKQANAKSAGRDAATVQMDLVMSMGKSVQYDPDKIKTMKAEFDKVTSAGCPIDRELMLSTLKAKSLGQALK